MSEALYSLDILRLAVSIPHQKRLKEPDGTADLRSKTCGSRVAADVILSDDGLIEELGIEVSACALGQASAAIVSREAVGRTIAEIEQAQDHLSSFLQSKTDALSGWKDIDLLAVARDHPGRHEAILLPYDAIIAAVLDTDNADRAA